MSDTLAAELRAEAKEMRRRDLLNPDRMFDGLHVAIVAFAQRFEDAAAALERAERVVEAARAVQLADDMDEGTALLRMYAALAANDAVEISPASMSDDDLKAAWRRGELRVTRAYDGQVVSEGPNKLPNHNLTRPCPNSVSFCGGPDRYGDTCAGCLATWTEEARDESSASQNLWTASDHVGGGEVDER